MCRGDILHREVNDHLQASQIDTRGYQSLLNLVDNTTNDSFDLYYGLFMYNKVPPPHGHCTYH